MLWIATDAIQSPGGARAPLSPFRAEACCTEPDEIKGKYGRSDTSLADEAALTWH
jgi:hypothetical protein